MRLFHDGALPAKWTTLQRHFHHSRMLVKQACLCVGNCVLFVCLYVEVSLLKRYVKGWGCQHETLRGVAWGGGELNGDF